MSRRGKTRGPPRRPPTRQRRLPKTRRTPEAATGVERCGSIVVVDVSAAGVVVAADFQPRVGNEFRSRNGCVAGRPWIGAGQADPLHHSRGCFPKIGGLQQKERRAHGWQLLVASAGRAPRTGRAGGPGCPGRHPRNPRRTHPSRQCARLAVSGSVDEDLASEEFRARRTGSRRAPPTCSWMPARSAVAAAVVVEIVAATAATAAEDGIPHS